MNKRPEGWLAVSVIVLANLILILILIILAIYILSKPKEKEIEEPFFEEEPLTLDEMLAHDLAFKFAVWDYQQIEEGPEVVKEEEDLPFFTEVEKWLIARVVMSEASTESFTVKQAIAEVVINRMFSDYREFRYQTAVDEVCLKPLQWATDQTPTDECYEAVEAAIRENKYPDDMLWARRDYVDYGYEYTVEEGSVTKFSTVTNYANEKAAGD